MQQPATSNGFQDSSKCKARQGNGRAEKNKPSAGVVQMLLAYAEALRVFKTKSLGNLNILMN
jgi:hypothetical protein